MARKSSASLSVITISGDRPKAPAELNKEARAQWLVIVDSLDPDYFRASDYPLLAAYCAACAMHAESVRMIATDGAVVDGKINPWVGIQDRQLKTMAAYAMKLRLCPEARYERDKASLAKRKAKAPWQDEKVA